MAGILVYSFAKEKDNCLLEYSQLSNRLPLHLLHVQAGCDLLVAGHTRLCHIFVLFLMLIKPKSLKVLCRMRGNEK